jgi:hypothetical protein
MSAQSMSALAFAGAPARSAASVSSLSVSPAVEPVSVPPVAVAVPPVAAVSDSPPLDVDENADALHPSGGQSSDGASSVANWSDKAVALDLKRAHETALAGPAIPLTDKALAVGDIVLTILSTLAPSDSDPYHLRALSDFMNVSWITLSFARSKIQPHVERYVEEFIRDNRDLRDQLLSEMGGEAGVRMLRDAANAGAPILVRQLATFDAVSELAAFNPMKLSEEVTKILLAIPAMRARLK